MLTKRPCVRSRIPVSNSVTAIEIWLLACILLVFLTLVEYAVILREGVRRRTLKHKQLQEYLEHGQGGYHQYPTTARKQRHIVTKIDKSVNVIQVSKEWAGQTLSKDPSSY